MRVKLGIRAATLVFIAGWVFYSLLYCSGHLASVIAAATLFGMACNDVRTIIVDRREVGDKIHA